MINKLSINLTYTKQMILNILINTLNAISAVESFKETMLYVLSVSRESIPWNGGRMLICFAI